MEKEIGRKLDKMDNKLFETAIKENKLLEFARGKGKYFLQDREYEEHWVLGSWINYIEPIYLLDKELCKRGLRMMFHELINAENNVDLVIENLLYHVYVAYYLISEGRMQDTLAILKEIESDIGEKINVYKTHSSSSQSNEIDTSIKMIKGKGGLKEL